MTKHLETAKIKKHCETIAGPLDHIPIGNKSSINMISRRPLRLRGSSTKRPRGTSPRPRQRISCIAVEEEYIVKAEDTDDATEMVRLQYFAEEAAINKLLRASDSFYGSYYQWEDSVTTGEEDQYRELCTSFNQTRDVDDDLQSQIDRDAGAEI
eukprot:1369580-Amphidinium_carterae.2